MIPIKATFDAVGAGAGMSWPVFGILLPSLGLAVGGGGAIFMGSTAGLLFLLISLPIFYFSYTTLTEEKKLLNAKIDKNLMKLNDELGYYLQISYRQFLADQTDEIFTSGDFLTFLKQKLTSNPETSKTTYLLMLNHLLKSPQVTLLISKVLEQNEYDFTKALRETNLVNANLCLLNNTKTPPPVLAVAFLMGFVSAFGAVVGCSAGFVGMLTGVGLFAGLASFPLLGISILMATITLAIVAAFTAVERADEKYLKGNHSVYLKTIHKELSDINMELSINNNYLVRFSKKAVLRPMNVSHANSLNFISDGSSHSQLFAAHSSFTRDDEGSTSQSPGLNEFECQT